MSKQKNLMSFFKPVSAKRTSSEALDNAESLACEKKQKIEAGKLEEEKSDSTHSVVSGENLKTPSKEVTGDSVSTKSENDAKVLNVPSTPPNQPVAKKVMSTPLGMLTPLQCLAKIKSQCAKTPALHHSIGHTWFFALNAEFQKPYFSKLSEFVTEERRKATVFPPADMVWTWTTKVPIKDIKVVILGQDPYHNPNQAHGLCFSVPKGVSSPPSLVNMYKELTDDIPGFTAPNHGYLDGWAQQGVSSTPSTFITMLSRNTARHWQYLHGPLREEVCNMAVLRNCIVIKVDGVLETPGVLLLNACLTVRANSPNSHKDRGWEQLTDAVIKYLSENGRNIVFLLWGSYAQKKGAVVDKKKHHILKTVHPSPLSAHRGFFGCKHFSQCNEFLKKAGRKPIDWAHLP